MGIFNLFKRNTMDEITETVDTAAETPVEAVETVEETPAEVEGDIQVKNLYQASE
jgi:hypothetical protein